GVGEGGSECETQLVVTRIRAFGTSGQNGGGCGRVLGPGSDGAGGPVDVVAAFEQITETSRDVQVDLGLGETVRPDRSVVGQAMTGIDHEGGSIHLPVGRLAGDHAGLDLVGRQPAVSVAGVEYPVAAVGLAGHREDYTSSHRAPELIGSGSKVCCLSGRDVAGAHGEGVLSGSGRITPLWRVCGIRKGPGRVG